MPNTWKITGFTKENFDHDSKTTMTPILPARDLGYGPGSNQCTDVEKLYLRREVFPLTAKVFCSELLTICISNSYIVIDLGNHFRPVDPTSKTFQDFGIHMKEGSRYKALRAFPIYNVKT